MSLESIRVVYLFIMFSVAAVGIATLWVQQRRERAHLESSERFLSSLQKISPEVRPVQRRVVPRRSPHSHRPPAQRRTQPVRRTVSGRPVRIDPARREAARRRVEARRRAERRTAGSRAFS